MYSEDAEELIIATLGQETLGGRYVRQIKGPALGIYQMEPMTYDSLWAHYISQDEALARRILNGCQYLQRPPSEHLVHNLKLATMMTRIFYRQIRDPLPKKEDIDGIWDYYKSWYNTKLGRATKDEFIKNYVKFVGIDLSRPKAVAKKG